MKILLYGLAIILCLCLIPYQNTVSAQQSENIIRGERPPIDLSRVPKEAYEPGKLVIKIADGISEMVPQRGLSAGAEGYVITGLPAIDSVNRLFGVEGFKPYFSALYETNSKTSEYKERHKAWGFHLWFELTIDSRSEIIAAVRQFSALDEITFAEPVYKVRLVLDDPALNSSEPITLDYPDGGRWTPNDPQYPNQWHYNNTGQQTGTPGADIDLQNAWNIERGNSDVIVAIIDGGIDINHVDLAANMWNGIGFNFVNNNSSIIPHNHGTHVAGTVAAVTNNAVGVAGVAGGSGLGDGVRLMSCQVFTSSSSGGFHIAPVYAADNGAAISQNSWGYVSAGIYSQPVLDAIDYFNAHGGGNALEGGITIFAAGNSNSSGLWYPACYSGSFSVAATNNQDKKAWYSNFDTWVDISAPGGETNVMTARGVLSTLNGNSYGYYQGTSMACPHASGIAALMASLGYGEITAVQVSEILRTTTDYHYAVNPTFIGKLGTGRLNAHNALLEVLSFLTGVANPYNFIANPFSNSQINLSWSNNFNNDEVLLLFSTDTVFGTPQNGIPYIVGQTLPGGGTVLLAGTGNEFYHTNLNAATTYYYRIYSYNSDNEYSSGRLAIASTFCDHIVTLPFVENFNASQSLPVCWDMVDHVGNGQVWKFGRGGLLVGTVGNYAYLNSDSYGSGNSQNADLVTAALDLTGYTGITLTFKHYFRMFSGTLARLYYSIDNGSTWTLLQTWNYSTTNPAVFSMPLPQIDGQANVRIKWKYTGTYGYYWSVDDVEITGVSSDLILSNMIIPSTIDTCMSALQSIIVAGGGTTFSIEDGGNIELVAGLSISLLDGTHVQEGAYMLGRISTNGEFCNNPESLLVNKELEDNTEFAEQLLSDEDDFFRIFPNPSNGILTLAVNSYNHSIGNSARIFNLVGEELKSIEISEPTQTMNISGLPSGVYIIKVISGDKIGFKKLVKN